jgi:hypothetical protein
MRSYKVNVLWLLISLLFLCAIVFATTRYKSLASSKRYENHQRPDKLQENDETDEQSPLIDYNAPESTDSVKRTRRKKKGVKYNNAFSSISESSARVTHINEGVPLSALPVEQSAVIIIGTVAEAEAVLSSKRTGVYSEFTIQIDGIFKDDSQQLTPSTSLVAERQGGRVRFPSGHITIEHVTGTRMPQAGKRYLLFLTRIPLDQSLYIHFGYELTGSKVALLDKYPGHPSQSYKGVDAEKLISDLRAALVK